jgi:D-alanine-D-alanine ligase
VTVLFDAAASDAPDEADNRRQVEEIGAALKRLGCQVRKVAVGPDLAALGNEDAKSLGTAFNLVEGLGGAHFLYSAVAKFLEWRGVPVTGASGDQLLTLSNKLLLRRMIPSGIAMPALPSEPGAGGRFIVKSVCEHSSLGLDASSVVKREDVAAAIAEREMRYGGQWFAETFVPGREFSIAGIATPKGVELFPPTEILFDKVPAGVPKILDYASKWEEGEDAFTRTPRQFLDARAEAALVARIKSTSRSLWEALALRGYARFDYRLSRNGKLFLIDVNANPCLTSDAGFMAAAEAAGHTFDETIGAILEASALPMRTYPPLALPEAPSSAVAANGV